MDGGRAARIRPDADHPLSRGYACPKGIAMVDVQNDPDRVTRPLRRTPAGDFEPVSWQQALDDIGARLRGLLDAGGPSAVGWYMGNPGAFSYSHALWVKGFLEGLGSPHYYTASSQDVSNRFAASALLYGSPLVVPIPDLGRTDFLLMIGANPMVSHGSVLTAPRVREQLLAIRDRGGRVLVVDPRRSETARALEHVPITPDTDAWFLLSVLCALFEEGLADRSFLAGWADGAAELEAAARRHPPEETADRTGIPAPRVREIARAMAAAEGASCYGRTGSCLGRFGTLVAFLIDAVNAVTGNLDRPGGAVFGDPPLALDAIGAQAGLDSYGRGRSRLGGFPDVLGALPASLMAKEITTPGEGRLRALFVSAGNPVLSVPNGDELAGALGELDLMVALDLYVTETGRHADYVLPATTFLEREDLPVAFLGFYTTPFIQATAPVVEPRGEARQEWELIEEVARRIGVVPAPVAALRRLGRLGIRLSAPRLLDLLLRTGPAGDLYGLRPGGLTLRKVMAEPHGIVLGDHPATGVLRRKLYGRRKRLQLAPPQLAPELERLEAANGHDPDFPLLLVGLRELRSHNSWMHNAGLLMRGGRSQPLRVHPDDAARHGLEDGGRVRLESKSGAVEVEVAVTDEMMPGTVALPHGWGHRGGGWQLANQAGGVNVNRLASSEPEDLEPLAGMAFLNGIPVRMEPVTPAAAPAAHELATA